MGSALLSNQELGNKPMKYQPLLPETEEVERDQDELDLVIPFTTPTLTRAAIRAAEQLGKGLTASIRLIQLQLVPYQVEMCPVDIGFLQQQLSAYESSLPLQALLLLTRETDAELLHALRPESIVVLACPKSLFPSSTENLARKVRRAGYKVVIVRA